MRDYGKVHTSFWASNSIRELSEDGRTLAFYLLTCPHGTIAGAFRLPDGYICEDLQWSVERVSKGFADLVSKGFANRCETTKWVQIINHFEWNPPENPNQKKAVMKIAQQVPDGCCWKDDFINKTISYLGLNDLQQEQLVNPSATVSKSVTVTVAGTVLNTSSIDDVESDSGEQSSPSFPHCPHAKLIEVFAEQLPMLPKPKIELWGGARARNMRNRWKWVLTAKTQSGKRYAETEDEAVDFFVRFFGYVAKSDFLTGRNGKWAGCTLAWLMEEANFAKAIEGSYESVPEGVAA